mgnify:CR=1 FL=1
MSSAPCLRLEHVSFRYAEHLILDDVNLSVAGRELISIVGPNGGGKTTLLRLILGLLQPTAGRVRLFGAPPAQTRCRVGYMPQHPQFDPHFPVTAREVVLMGRVERRRFGPYRRADLEAALAALADMQIADLASAPFQTLSGGQRQRVLIARALACEPDLLLLDEPTANVDLAAETKLFEILQTLNRRMAILIVSHDLGFVSRVVSTVVCVNRRVVVHPTSEITGEIIAEIYGSDLRMVRHDHRCSAEGHRHA